MNYVWPIWCWLTRNWLACIASAPLGIARSSKQSNKEK